jgi:DNA-binding XRE family transcriptional regulator
LGIFGPVGAAPEGEQERIERLVLRPPFFLMMRQSRANYRRVKIHRSYTVEEVARLFGVHKNTVRAWIKDGLQVCDGKRPTLILGRELATFLQSRRESRKRPCRPGELYCFRCRAPKPPALRMADYTPMTDKFGNLAAICADCECIMNQRVSMAKLGGLKGRLDIRFRWRCGV